jgi:heme exporter protein D
MFWVVFGITLISLIWLHCVVLRIRRYEQQAI